MNEIFKAIASMTLLCLAAGFVIAVSHASTAQFCKRRAVDKVRSAVEQVLVAGTRIVDSATDGPAVRRFWVGKKDSSTVGYAFLAQTRGYCGLIGAIVGIDTGGMITGLVIISENESPTMGGRSEETVSKSTLWNGLREGDGNARPWFCEQFKGITPCKPIIVSTSEEWPLLTPLARKDLLDKNAVSAISGATVSSRAIVGAVEKAAAAFNAVRGIRR